MQCIVYTLAVLLTTLMLSVQVLDEFPFPVEQLQSEGKCQIQPGGILLIMGPWLR